MKTVEAIVLGREDIREDCLGKDIRYIDYNDFKISNNVFTQNAIILFVDDNCQSKILKNRFGDKGNSIFIKTIEDIKQNCIDNQIGLGEEYFDDILRLIPK